MWENFSYFHRQFEINANEIEPPMSRGVFCKNNIHFQSALFLSDVSNLHRA